MHYLWHKGYSWTRDCTLIAFHPPAHHFDTEDISPSTVTLSTDSCRLLPLRTTFTVCHSLSFSFCPANSVSGPLPVVGDGEGIQNHKWHSGIAVRTTYTHPHTHRHSSRTAGDSAGGENLHVWGTRSPYWICRRTAKMETTKYSDWQTVKLNVFSKAHSVAAGCHQRR